MSDGPLGFMLGMLAMAIVSIHIWWDRDACAEESLKPEIEQAYWWRKAVLKAKMRRDLESLKSKEPR